VPPSVVLDQGRSPGPPAGREQTEKTHRGDQTIEVHHIRLQGGNLHRPAPIRPAREGTEMIANALLLTPVLPGKGLPYRHRETLASHRPAPEPRGAVAFEEPVGVIQIPVPMGIDVEQVHQCKPSVRGSSTSGPRTLSCLLIILFIPGRNGQSAYPDS